MLRFLKRPGARRARPQQENLHFASAGLARMQAGRDDPAVVAHQQVAGPQILGHVAEMTVLQIAGLPIHYQQARSIARLDGLLSDQLRGQEIVEVAGFHCPSRCSC